MIAVNLEYASNLSDCKIINTNRKLNLSKGNSSHTYFARNFFIIKNHIDTVSIVRDSFDYLSLFNHRIEEGFDFFFKKYYLLLCIYANKIINDKSIAEEIASDSFLSTWHTQNCFTSVSNLKSFLFVAAKHGAINYLRKKKVSEGHIDTLLTRMTLTTQSHEEAFIKAESFMLLIQSIETLPPRCKVVCKKLFIEGQKVSEIAKELGVTRSTIKSHKATGIVILKKIIRVHKGLTHSK